MIIIFQNQFVSKQRATVFKRCRGKYGHVFHLLPCDTILIIHTVITKAFPLSDCRGQWISIKESSQPWQLQTAWKSIIVKNNMITCALKMWGKGHFHDTNVIHGKESASWEQCTPFSQYDTHRMGISKADMRGKCLLLHWEAATTEGAVLPKYDLQWLWQNNENNDSDCRQR